MLSDVDKGLKKILWDFKFRTLLVVFRNDEAASVAGKGLKPGRLRGALQDEARVVKSQVSAIFQPQFSHSSATTLCTVQMDW